MKDVGALILVFVIAQITREVLELQGYEGFSPFWWLVISSITIISLLGFWLINHGE